MSWVNAATFVWLGASLVLFGAALFPFYAGKAGTAAHVTLMRWCALAALTFGALAIALRTSSLGATPLQMFETGIGRTWLAQSVCAVALVALTWRTSRAGVIAGVAAFQVLGFALVGHANAIAGLTGAGVQALHLLAAGAWIGGLAGLTLGLRETPSAEMAKRFSIVGFVCVLTLAVTGAYVLFVNTGIPLPMKYYAYGRLADLKIKLFAGAVVLAGFNRFFATPRGAWRTMIGLIAGELAVLALVVAAAIGLAGTEPYS